MNPARMTSYQGVWVVLSRLRPAEVGWRYVIASLPVPHNGRGRCRPLELGHHGVHVPVRAQVLDAAIGAGLDHVDALERDRPSAPGDPACGPFDCGCVTGDGDEVLG